jgi:hypothetical protein
MSLYEVKLSNGVFCAHIDEGVVPAIRDGAGKAVSQFMPGWEPESLFCGAAPISCLGLKHSSGQRAIWYLDQQFNRVGGGFKELHVQHHRAFARLAEQFEAAIRSRILCARAGVDERIQALLNLPALARHDITLYLLNEQPAKHHTFVLDGAEKQAIAGTMDLISSLGSYPDALRHVENLLLRTDLKAALSRGIAKHSLALSSPLDDVPTPCNGTLLLQPRAIAYRFCDHANGVPYYVLTADWRQGICAVYFPSIHLTVYGNSGQRTAAENSLGGEFHRVIFQHAAAQSDNLQHYNAPPNAQIRLVYSYWHLGHHLWNELAGLDYLLGQLSSDQIPPIHIVQAEKTEMYGRLDELFPEIMGRVDRSLSSMDQLRQAIYRENRICIALNDTRVSRSLASRIIRLAESTALQFGAVDEFKRLIDDGYQIILLGLRVENRTVADFPRFCEELIEDLGRELGKVAIVLDGHNIAQGAEGAYISHRQDPTLTSPIVVERELVERLTRTFNGHPDVRLIDTVGRPMSISIFWSTHCRFFVTPWGAGLAKYRWVSNSRGLVLAGHLFQEARYRQTLHLYDDPACMESPAPLYFLDRDAVSDAPESPLLIPDASDVTRVNFRIDHAALNIRLKELIVATSNAVGGSERRLAQHKHT